MKKEDDEFNELVNDKENPSMIKIKIPFSEVYSSVYDHFLMKGATVHPQVCFLVMLHISNELQIPLKNNDTRFADFMIG